MTHIDIRNEQHDKNKNEWHKYEKVIRIPVVVVVQDVCEYGDKNNKVEIAPPKQ